MTKYIDDFEFKANNVIP